MKMLSSFPKTQRKEIERRMALTQKARAIVEKVKKEKDTEKLSKLLDRETLFRFAYIPFVVAKLAWDYADTILYLCVIDKRSETKPLCRAVKELKTEYDRERAPYIGDVHQASEEENMYVFENGVEDIFNLYLANIGIDLRSEYPLLEDSEIYYLKAVYQCHIVLLSLYKYCEMQRKKISKMLNKHVGDILPSSLRRLDGLIMAFVGDKPISTKLSSQHDTYALNLANRMHRIELSEEKDG